MNKLLVALLATLTVGSAMATGKPEPVTPATPNSTSSSNSAANAGAVAVGGRSSSSAVVSGSGNSRNTINSSNRQNQTQGQAQGQRQTATGGQGGAGGQGGLGGTANASGGTGVGSQGQSTYIEGDSTHVEAARRSAASPYAPPLTSSNDTCMGSVTGGLTVAPFGITGGTTTVDKNCVMLKNARELWNMGMKEAALARLCMDAENKEALEITGTQCPTRNRQSSGGGVPFPNAGANNEGWDRNDPYIRARMEKQGLAD